MTGMKTRAGVVNIQAGVERGNCAASIGKETETLLEIAEQHRMATGVVTTTRVTHATPAATFAHAPERDWEADIDLPKDALELGCHDIARQLIEFPHGDGIEVVMGGWTQKFLAQRL